MQTKTNDDKPVLISFIVTYYNLTSDMLNECILSIIALDLEKEEYEIIIIDDGSTICLEENIKAIDISIKYIRQKNQGLSGARNTGLKLAKGKYIQFVDGDDSLISKNYSKCIELLKEQETNMLMFHASGKQTLPSIQIKTEKESGPEYMLHNNLRASAWGYLFKKDTLGELCFTFNTLHEDEEFTPLLMLQADSVLSTNIKCYFYRTRKGSIINRHDEEWSNRRLNDLMDIIRRLYDKSKTLKSTNKAALERRVNQLCMDYIYQSWNLTGSFKVTKERANRLKQYGLFPLANKHYTWKYSIFRIISKCLL